MGRRDYIAAAFVLKRERDRFDDDDAARLGVECAARGLCEVFSEDNGRFSRDRFLTACGVDK
jgi:hypothetical protein